MRSLTFFLSLHCLVSVFAIISFCFRLHYYLLASFRLACVCVCERAPHIMSTVPHNFSPISIFKASKFRFVVFFCGDKNTSDDCCDVGSNGKQQDNGRIWQSESVSIEKTKMNFAKIVWNDRNYYEHHTTIYNDNNNDNVGY